MKDGIHAAIIMDGNGRWARARGLPRVAGHREGCKAVGRVVEAAAELDIATLTLYAFSSDNWQRPAAEVAALMDLFARYLRRERGRAPRHGIRLNIIGRRDRIDPALVREIERAERETAHGSKLHVRIAVDYSARAAILAAAGLARAGEQDSFEQFARRINQVVHSDPPVTDVDLLIRTSGECRLSDFLLWECAYAELLFTERQWPDYTADDLRLAVDDYRRRNRRYGRIAG